MMNWMHKLTGRKTGPDGFSYSGKDELAAEHEEISKYLEEALLVCPNYYWNFKVGDVPLARELLSKPAGDQALLVTALQIRLIFLDNRKRDDEKRMLFNCRYLLLQLMRRFMGRKQPWADNVLINLAKWCSAASWGLSRIYPTVEIVKLLEEKAAEIQVSEELKEASIQLCSRMLQGDDGGGVDTRDAEDMKLQVMAERLQSSFTRRINLVIHPGDVWSDAALAEINALEPEVQAWWADVFSHAAGATQASPGAAWLKQIKVLLKSKVQQERFRTVILRWLPLVDHGRSQTDRPEQQMMINDHHLTVLRGLAWACGTLPDKDNARALTALALTSYKKIPGLGPRAVRVGNACITALGLMANEDALGQLALLKVKVKFGGAQAAIDKALNKLAEKLGIPREDLEEMSVPAYGLQEVGKLTLEFGEFTGELSVVNSRKTHLRWFRKDGKEQKTLPAQVKKEFGEDLKEIQTAKKDLEKMLPALSERLDNLYLQRKSWAFEDWRERYADHPLMGALARRLIWNFGGADVITPAIWLKDQWVDRLGNPVSFTDGMSITLWHPLQQPVDVVLGWRGFLEEWEIVQPFKQAHREVYLLTPAEEQTRVYSNRFAAHLLRQHQFNALCSARGWKNRLRLMVDDTYPPATRWLTPWGLRAEFWIEGAGSDYGVDTLESGAYRYVTTDQVRFYQEEAPQVDAHAGGGGYSMGWTGTGPDHPLPLSEIPALVFSEVMRDVDLFVGVGSVGNDPNWLDGGTNTERRGYWQHYSFGELTESAKSRKEILQRLIPKLKIAGQCHFMDNYLVVQGKRHAYKIHLGSGNILIAPQDKYLCIVAGQSQVEKGTNKVFLPFEGDRILSLIISKAFLLAADDKITDPTILRQL